MESGMAGSHFILLYAEFWLLKSSCVLKSGFKSLFTQLIVKPVLHNTMGRLCFPVIYYRLYTAARGAGAERQWAILPPASHVDSHSGHSWSTSILAPNSAAGKVVEDVPSNWDPTTHLCDPDDVQGSRLWLALVLVIVAIWGINQQM